MTKDQSKSVIELEVPIEIDQWSIEQKLVQFKAPENMRDTSYGGEEWWGENRIRYGYFWNRLSRVCLFPII